MVEETKSPDIDNPDRERDNQANSASARPAKSQNWWRYLIWIFIFLIIFISFVQRSNKDNLTYTQFLEDVKNGNVASVVFRNHQIEGRFTDAYLKSVKGKKPSQAFVTRMPVIQGSGLLDLLETHNVTTDAKKPEHFPWIVLVFILPWILFIGYIFIDEIDSIGRSRGTGVGGGHDEREQTLNQILSEMDGFEPYQSVVVIAATNRPDVLDPALTRPGRFDRQITLPLPDKKARIKMLEIHIRKVRVAADVDFETIAAGTVGFSGADIKNLVNEATLLAGRENKSEVQKEDFEQARDKIILGMAREDVLEEEEKKLISYHESGHALAAQLLDDTDPLQKVTIIPRGRSLGATEQVPKIDRHNLSKNYLLSIIAVRLAGRAAEEIVYNDVSSGANVN